MLTPPKVHGHFVVVMVPKVSSALSTLMTTWSHHVSFLRMRMVSLWPIYPPPTFYPLFTLILPSIQFSQNLDFWQSFGEACTRGRIKTCIFAMENLLMQLHVGRKHWSPSNCSERAPWQYSCSNQSCRLCFQAPLDLRGQVRMSAAGLLGWEVILKVWVA